MHWTRPRRSPLLNQGGRAWDPPPDTAARPVTPRRGIIRSRRLSTCKAPDTVLRAFPCIHSLHPMRQITNWESEAQTRARQSRDPNSTSLTTGLSPSPPDIPLLPPSTVLEGKVLAHGSASVSVRSSHVAPCLPLMPDGEALLHRGLWILKPNKTEWCAWCIPWES